MSYLIYADIISSFLDSRHVDPGSILIHVSVYGPSNSGNETHKFI